jgi:hypothetical protein
MLPFNLTEDEAAKVLALLEEEPFLKPAISNSSRVNLSLEHYQIKAPINHYKGIELKDFLYRSETSSVKVTDIIAQTCHPILDNKIRTSFTQLGITQAAAKLWETLPLKKLAEYLLILYPKDLSSKSDTLQRITAWKLQYYDPIFDILNTAGEDVKYGQLFEIKSLATPAEIRQAFDVKNS